MMKPILLPVLGFLTAFVLSPSMGRSDDTLPEKRNVVILLADDLGWGDVGYHGGKAKTPNIDGLAREGIQLNRFYAYPACSPARAAMLTGRFPHRYGIAGPVRPRDVGLPLDEQLLPAAFQQAGYETSLIGKWHLGLPSQAEAHPTRRGFDHFYGFLNESIDYFQHTEGRGQVDWQRDGITVNEQGYSTDLLADEAVRQINASKKGKPFCIVVSFNAPHTPFQAPETMVDKYRTQMNPQEATYAAMVDAMDQGIGRILAAIDDQKLREETIVVFASDNGAARAGTNAPFRGQKRQVYEGGIHVPCVIRTPGVLKPGTVSNQLCSIHDLFPTLASANGVTIKSTKPIDGVALWSALAQGEATDRTVIVAETDHTIIRGDWKLIQLANGNTELYDLGSDPTETKNVANNQTTIAGELTQLLQRFQRSVEQDTAFVADSQMATNDELQEGEALAKATLTGDAKYGILGDPRVESNGRGVRLLSSVNAEGNKPSAGEATIVSTKVNADQRWYRFHISGLAQDNFSVGQDDLYLKVEFFQNGGTDSLDFIKERIYSQVLQERKDFFDKDTNESLGHATWRTYAMDFRTPFVEVDMIKLSVGFANGKGYDKKSEFWINAMTVEPIDAPTTFQAKTPSIHDFPQPNVLKLVVLGGRWYYNPKGGDRTLPKQFDHTNADQLLYKSDRFEAPFAGNMSSWLRAGYLDIDGNPVEKDQYKPDAVVITFTDKHLVMRSRNLPNHPTATFPDRWRILDGNPSYIKEQANVWYLPLEPKRNPKAIAMDAKNSNQALPMGPIDVATNGVIFFNPFDHIFETDAVWRLDRCCGHPSPQQQYHYHKYPLCVKTP